MTDININTRHETRCAIYKLTVRELRNFQNTPEDDRFVWVRDKFYLQAFEDIDYALDTMNHTIRSISEDA